MNDLKPKPKPKLSQLTPEQALAEWATLSDMLAPALEHGRMSERTNLDVLLKEISEGYTQVFLVWVPEEGQVLAVFLVKLHVYPTGLRVLQFPALGGHDLSQWVDYAWDGIRDFARAQGCDQIEIRGRPGWAKVLSAEPVSVNFVEAL